MRNNTSEYKLLRFVNALEIDSAARAPATNRNTREQLVHVSRGGQQSDSDKRRRRSIGLPQTSKQFLTTLYVTNLFCTHCCRLSSVLKVFVNGRLSQSGALSTDVCDCGVPHFRWTSSSDSSGSPAKTLIAAASHHLRRLHTERHCTVAASQVASQLPRRRVVCTSTPLRRRSPARLERWACNAFTTAQRHGWLAEGGCARGAQ